MKYFLIAGEASGDLHGANLISELRKQDPNATVHCWGGDLMKKAGAKVLKHYQELAFMGFLEVLKNLPTILNNFKRVKKEIRDFSPDVLILIDYPGFNLRLTKWAQENNIRVFYYISPQLWAWHAGRVDNIKKYVERMYVILPFEVEWYKDRGVVVDYEGHPLMDIIETEKPTDPNNKLIRKELGLNLDLPIIALLPGSRKQEIRQLLEVMLSIVSEYPQHQFVIAGAPSIESFFYQPFIEGKKNVKLVNNRTYELLRISYSALVTSGTATLETSLFGVPQVVCYRGNPISFALAKLLVGHRINHIAMPNIIAGKEVVKELIQKELTKGNLKQELNKTLYGPTRNTIIKEYQMIREKLGQKGGSRRIASLMINRLNLKK